MNEARFVVIGGGTGISTLLSGLKRFTDEITAIVTMADDGGGSGELRKERGILPPGDIRSCLVALANTQPLLENILKYRYSEGSLRGQNLGNLLIAALIDIYGSFDEAIKNLSQALKITGTVLPVTTEDIKLEALFTDGTRLLGESKIPLYARQKGVRIRRMDVVPSLAKGNRDSIEAIEKSDILVLGPGSLYTSLIPNIRIKGVYEAISRSPAPLVYIANIMTQKGETDGYDLLDHIQALEDHGLEGRIGHLILNTRPIQAQLVAKYQAKEGVGPIHFDENILQAIEKKGIQIHKGDFLSQEDGVIRHNALLLSQRLLSLSDRFRNL